MVYDFKTFHIKRETASLSMIREAFLISLFNPKLLWDPPVTPPCHKVKTSLPSQWIQLAKSIKIAVKFNGHRLLVEKRKVDVGTLSKIKPFRVALLIL